MHVIGRFGAKLLVGCAAAALVLTGCSRTEAESTAPSSAEQPAITGQPAGFNADDVAYANNAIAHHEQSVELSALVPARSTNPDVIALASEISAAQQQDQELMKVLLVQWNENPDNSTGQSGHGAGVMGTVDEATVTMLTGSSGPEFDALWLRSMIAHQQGAVAMAEAETATGANVDAVATAKGLIGSYGEQIGRMQQMLDEGPGEG